jgi:hypothetical protein
MANKLFLGMITCMTLVIGLVLAGCDTGVGGGSPPAPAGVQAEALSSSSVRISWNEVSGATGYLVYYEPARPPLKARPERW